jgi:hypothetical protein
MRNSSAVQKVLLLFSFSLFALSTFSQTKKVLIVPLEDTVLVNCHVGFTAFTNSSELLKIDIPLGNYIKNKLKEYLSQRYEVGFAYPSPEIGKKQSKEFKRWLEEKQKGYDLVILIRNIDISNEMLNAPIPKFTTGFYSRGRMHGVYTSISFEVRRVDNGQRLEYYESHKAFENIKDFKMPKDKNAFDQPSLEIIKEALLKHQDTRIKYFLAKTYLVPELK